MTDKELRKLSRNDLLQMLVEQGKELRTLKEKYAEAEAALQDRSIQIEKAGSIAEAALQLNGVFEAAQAACQQYSENIAQLSQRQEAICAQREAESRAKAKGIVEEAEQQAALLEQKTKEQCAELLQTAQTQAQSYWDEVSTRLQAFMQEHSEIKDLLLNTKNS